MQFRHRPLAASVAAALFHRPLRPGPDPTASPVHVTAPREVPAPAGATVLTASEIAGRRASSSDTARLLEGIPGLSFLFAGGISSLPAIHGLADDRLRLRVDGMDLVSSCHNHMNPPLSTLDPAQVSSVKVWSGVAPVSVGGDAIGGAVVVESTAPAFSTGRRHDDRGRDRRPLPQQQRGHRREPVGHPARRIDEPHVQRRSLQEPTTGRPPAISSRRPRPPAPATRCPSTRSARPPTVRATTPSPSRRDRATTSSRRSWATRTSRSSSTPTSAWTCSTTRRSAARCAISARCRGARSTCGRGTRRWTTTWTSARTSASGTARSRSRPPRRKPGRRARRWA